MLDVNKREQISIQIIRVLKVRFTKFPEDAEANRNAPFHESFLKAFSEKLKKGVTDIPYFISLSSWLHGLNTTLGQSFFENTAHILSSGQKRSFKGQKISKKQKQVISNIITDLKNSARKPDVTAENKLLFGAFEGDNELVDAFDFQADNIIIDESKGFVEAIELKSVRPNSGEMRGEKQKILNGKAVLKKLYPGKEIRFFIGFPFDPLNEEPTGYDKVRFKSHLIEMDKFFANDEILIADELWDRLSESSGTMKEILGLINAVSTKDFNAKFDFVNDPENIFVDRERYNSILDDWNLKRDAWIVRNLSRIEKNLEESKYRRIFSRKLFKERSLGNSDNYSVEYDYERYMAIKALFV